MNKLFRFVSLMVVLVMVLGFFAAPMSAANQVNAQKEVPTFVVAPTDIPVDPLPGTGEPTAVPPEGEPTPVPGEGEEPIEEVTPVPTELLEVVPLIEAAEDVAVPGRYIVVFKNGVDKEAARQSAVGLINTGGGKLAFEYSSALDGLTAEFSPEVLRKLRQDPRIEFIEMDQKVSIRQEEEPFSTQSLDTSPDSWGLDRIDQVNLPLDNQYYYPSSAGAGVNVYIIDTGIRNTHEQYAGRVSLDFDAIGGSVLTAYDCAGHGTHVAGTVGGNTTGIARRVNLHSVRVLDCTGGGYTSQIVAGINWVAKNHIKPAVANMSLGGWKSPAEDLAVSNAISKGVTFVVAAGNDDSNACSYSPARVPAAITVGATDASDYKADFSNYGKCVDIFAPGVDIYSSTMESNSSYDGTWDGTSMAAPHVTGVAALYLSANPTATPAQVTAYILNNALVGVVGNPGTGSPNRLLHIPSNIATGPTLVYPAADQVIAQRLPDFQWKYLTNTDRYYFQIASGTPNFSPPLNGIITDANHYLYDTPLEDGVYYWRVAAKNVDDTQEVWSTVRKFTVDKTGPAAPTLTFPAADAIVNGIPTFKWLASAGAKGYQVVFDFNTNPDDGILGTFNPTTYLYYKPAFLPDSTDVYWYVQAKDSLGNWGEWSTARKVTINPLKPAAPKLLTPATNFVTNDQTPDFTWSGVLYGNAYQIQIASNTTFTTIADEYEAPGLTYTADTLAEGKYYWRVRAKNSAGVYGLWTAYRTIIIDLTAPAAPNPTGPGNGANVTGTPAFTWSIPAGAKTYVLQFGNTPGFDGVTKLYTGIKTNTYKPVPVLPVGDWFWRVLAIDAAGNPGVYGPSRLVHVNPALPGKPNLVKPAQGIYTDQSTVEFEWTIADYADTYQIQFDNNSDFSSPAYQTDSDPGEFTESINIGSNLNPGKWYWRVRGVNVNGKNGTWSAARYFTYNTAKTYSFDSASDLDFFTQNPTDLWHWDTDGYVYNDGVDGTINTDNLFLTNKLTDFTVEARLKMDNRVTGIFGSNSDYYGLVFRGTPNFNYYNDWTKGYYFMILQRQNDDDSTDDHIGCFRVYSLNGYSWTMLNGFCDSAILENDWNDLKVSAKGNNLKFYINGYLMWQGTNSTYKSGQVGVFNYSYHCNDVACDPYTHDRMYVDTFSIGAPINTTSTEIRLPDPALGVGIDPWEMKKNQ